MHFESALPDCDDTWMQLGEDLKSLKIGGDNNAVHAIPTSLTSADDISYESLDSCAITVEENKGQISASLQEDSDDEMDTAGCDQTAQDFRKEPTIPYLYFVRISPVALDVSNIQPSFNTRDNFQLVAWRSPEGRIHANVTCDRLMEFVDPGKDGIYIVECLNDYMETHGKGLFLYIRAPDSNEQLGEIGEHIIDICALIEVLREFFEVMDVAWFPV